MNKWRLVAFAFLLAICTFAVAPAMAQCAACAATVESSSESGSKATAGLNNGILYLLATPYLAAAVVGFIWYKKFRRKSVELNMRNEKLHLN